MAHFFGHEHSEEFVIQVFRNQFENPDDEKSRATAVVLSAPSVTTYSSYTPAYRIYTVDGVYEGSSYVRSSSLTDKHQRRLSTLKTTIST